MLSTSKKWPMGTSKPELWIWLFGKHLPSQNLEPKVCIGTGKREMLRHMDTTSIQSSSFNCIPTSLQQKSL